MVKDLLYSKILLFKFYHILYKNAPLVKGFLEVSEKLLKSRSETSDYGDYKRLQRSLLIRLMIG
jgi:hypothetical protein